MFGVDGVSDTCHLVLLVMLAHLGSCNRALLRRQCQQLRHGPGRTSVLLFVSLVAWAHFTGCSSATSPVHLVAMVALVVCIALALGVGDQVRLALLGRQLHRILAAGQCLHGSNPLCGG
jgi:uncharacterized membrane protein